MKIIIILVFIYTTLAIDKYFSVYRNENTGKYYVLNGKDEGAIAWTKVGRESQETGIF